MHRYLGDRVAVGMMLVDDNGNDTMEVIHGTIRAYENPGEFRYYLDVENETPMEMSEKWLEKLKPVEASLGEKFAGAKHCLIIANLQKQTPPTS